MYLTRVEREQVVDGVLSFRREGKQPTDPLTWNATVRYGDRGPTWDIRAPLPPDHRFPGDIALRVQTAWVIYRALGERVPARGRIGDVFTAEVSNLFSDDASFRPLPFFVDGMGDHPLRYLERAYGWAWGS